MATKMMIMMMTMLLLKTITQHTHFIFINPDSEPCGLQSISNPEYGQL